MIVFKLSWLPYMLIIAGIALVAEGQGAAVILIIAGAAWLFLKYRNKKNAAAAEKAEPYTPVQSPNTTQPPVNPIPQAPVTPEQPAQATKFCTQCGTKAAEGSAFCANCGNKL